MSGTPRRVLAARQPALLEYLETQGFLSYGGPSGRGSVDLEAPGPDAYPGRLEVIAAADGEATLLAGGKLVHSRFAPGAEGRRLAASVQDGDGPLVVLGCGLGYAAEAAALAEPQRPLVVVERDPRVLAGAFVLRDLTALVDRDRVAFVCGGEPRAVASALQRFGGVPELLRCRALTELDQPWYAAAEDAVAAQGSRERTNRATMDRFGGRWLRNLAANAWAYRDLPGIAALEGSAAGLPFLVLAAGPSLDEDLATLPGLAARAIVVAVDTALRAVRRVGVEPDFVVSGDPQYWNYLHLADQDGTATALVIDVAAYPAALRSAFGNIFVFSSALPLSRYLEERVERKGTLASGGSVATSAWDLARFMGASSIFLAGLDLSYPSGATHFKGALFETAALARATRLRGADTWSYDSYEAARPYRAPALDGGTVTSDRRLALYASWFESALARPGAVPSYALSDRGLAVAGLRRGGRAILAGLPCLPASARESLRAAVIAASGDGGAEGPVAGKAPDSTFAVEGSRRRRGSPQEGAPAYLEERLEAALAELSASVRRLRDEAPGTDGPADGTTAGPGGRRRGAATPPAGPSGTPGAQEGLRIMLEPLRNPKYRGADSEGLFRRECDRILALLERARVRRRRGRNRERTQGPAESADNTSTGNSDLG